jgi:hypothetical protein
MTTARSLFTEAIEDHLALKKQNAALEGSMPLARYDVGDPLERFPGGPGRAAEGTVVVPDSDSAAVATGESMFDDLTTGTPLVGPSPEQAMEAATALETSLAGRPFEPLMGMTPMLSLVEDIEDEHTGQFSATTTTAGSSADVLRFPGGVGPRDQGDASTDAPVVDPLATQAFSIPTSAQPATAASPSFGDDAAEAATGEQPVLVIDSDEPFASGGWSDEPATASRAERRNSRPRFFGLGRKKEKQSGKDDAWFTEGARDFNWE